MGGFGPQDDVTAFRFYRSQHHGISIRKCFHGLPFGSCCIHKICKRNVTFCLQNRTVFDVYVPRPQHDTAAGVDLTGDLNALGRSRARIKFQIGRLEFALMLALGIPGSELHQIILERISKVSFITCQLVII